MYFSQLDDLMREELGRNTVPLSTFLPSNMLAVPHAVMPYQHPRCSIPSHLSCIKCKLQRIALTYAVKEGGCFSDMLAAVQSSAA